MGPWRSSCVCPDAVPTSSLLNPRLATMYVLCFCMRSIIKISRLKLQLQCIPLSKTLKVGLGPRYGHVVDLVAQRYLVTVSGNDGRRGSSFTHQLNNPAFCRRFHKLLLKSRN